MVVGTETQKVGAEDRSFSNFQTDQEKIKKVGGDAARNREVDCVAATLSGKALAARNQERR